MLGTLWPLRRDTARVGWRSVNQARERSRSKELTGSAIRIFFITQVPCHIDASQGRSTWHSDDERDVVCLLELDFSVIVLVQHVITKPSRIRPESVKSPDRRRSRPPESPRSEVPQPCHSCHHARVCPARERSSLHRRQPSPRMLGLALGAALHAGSRAARDHIARAGPARPASNPRCIHDPSRDDVDTRRPAQPPTVPPVPPPRRELRRSAKIPPGAPPWAVGMAPPGRARGVEDMALTRGQRNPSGGCGTYRNVGSTGPSEVTDAALMEASLQDPRRRRIFDRHAPVIHRYLVSRVGVEAAEDLASEVFVTAFRSRSSYDPEYNDALPWLLGCRRRHSSPPSPLGGRRWAMVRRLGQQSADRGDLVVGDVAEEAVARGDIEETKRALDTIEQGTMS